MESFLERNPNYFKEYYIKNKAKMNLLHQIWTENNIENQKKYRKEYNKKNKEKITNYKNKISNRVRKQKMIEKMMYENNRKSQEFKNMLLSQLIV